MYRRYITAVRNKKQYLYPNWQMEQQDFRSNKRKLLRSLHEGGDCVKKNLKLTRIKVNLNFEYHLDFCMSICSSLFGLPGL